MKLFKKILALVSAGMIYTVGTSIAEVSELLPGANITMRATAFTTDVPISGGLTSLSYNYLDDGTIEITDCAHSASGDLEIPSEFNGVAVTRIGDSAFEVCGSLTSVTIPKGVVCIDDYAFNYCRNITSIAIPETVTTIGIAAFYSCDSLTEITLPDGLTELGKSSFSYCRSLTSITIPDGITSIGTWTFNTCVNLATVEIPESVTSIGDYAFYGCTDLTDIYYGGTREQWDEMEIGTNNDAYLKKAAIHFGKVTTGSVVSVEGDLLIGDIDGDGSITINDAYNTLLAYSKISAGLESGLTEAQITAADVDGDGKITINDAFKILLYYATKSAGGSPSWD